LADPLLTEMGGAVSEASDKGFLCFTGYRHSRFSASAWYEEPAREFVAPALEERQLPAHSGSYEAQEIRGLTYVISVGMRMLSIAVSQS